MRLKSTYQERCVNSATATANAIRGHAREMLGSIGVSRIIIVDDEYAAELLEVEELLAICRVLKPPQAAELPNMQDIDFTSDPDIWAAFVREMWLKMDDTECRAVMEEARSLMNDESATDPSDVSSETRKDDTTAAHSLEELLGELEECQYVTLSLNQWRTRAEDLQRDERAATTLILFDRDFSREKEGADQEGLKLIEEIQRTNIGYYGLISHTVQKGGEYDAWCRMTDEHDLLRDRFVVIAKERLTGDLSEYYGFLGMLRLAALSGRFADVKSAAWCIFEKSVAAARATVEGLSVFDFDRIIFESSRREGVWEPDTLFRVFGILMRREAFVQLHKDECISNAFAEAKRLSDTEQEIASAVDDDCASLEALRIQRFESYESDADINRFHAPLELGDIFENCSNGKRYLLLVQPCDLMVRRNGKRSYDSRGRTGSLVELVVGRNNENTKDSWAELPYYEQNTGRPAFVNFAKVHHFLLNVLDLCSFREDGVACIEVGMECPELLIEPWKKRFRRLQNFYGAVLTQYEQLRGGRLGNEVQLLALPKPSGTVAIKGSLRGRTVRYGLKRVLRLRQPRSGALLTAFSQYQARAAFEHPFAHRFPTHSERNGSQENGEDEETR